MQKPLSLLWPLLSQHKAKLVVVLVAVSVAAATVLAFGWGLKHLVDQGFTDKSGRYLNQALLILLGVILLLAASSYTRFFLVHSIAERVIADLRKKVFRHLLSLDPFYFETHKTGEEVSRINTDTTVLQMVVTTNLPMAFRHFLTMTGGAVMLFIVSPSMMGMVFLAVPFLLGPIIYFGRKVRSKSRDTQGRIGDVAAFSHETIQGIQSIQSFGYEGAALQKFSDLVEDTFQAAIKYVKVRAFLTAFVISVIFSAIGIVLWIGGHRVLDGEMTAGDLSAFIFYAVTMAGAMGAISEAMTAFNQAAGAADRISSLLAETSRLRSAFSLEKMPVISSGEIRFEKVSFSYPTRPDRLALDAVSFDIPAGKTTALVGPSGAGKTTIFQLLQRFYDPAAGHVSVDGFDLLCYAPQETRRLFGVVSQDPMIFSASVADNIRVGNPDATEEDIHRAAKQAEAHGFITDLPEGYDTPIGERGSRLSGGQRQRIAIARALLRNPKILLLDEATSALDAANEQAVMLALRALMKGRTTVIIAHRLSTVQNADKIIVLDKGRVVAAGTHDSLYGKDSLYTHLAGLQLQAA